MPEPQRNSDKPAYCETGRPISAERVVQHKPARRSERRRRAKGYEHRSPWPVDASICFRVSAMVSTLFSTDDERWPLMAVLTWIATRSLKYVESYVWRDPSDAQALLALAKEGFSGIPGDVGCGYADAFRALAEKIESTAISGSRDKAEMDRPART